MDRPAVGAVIEGAYRYTLRRDWSLPELAFTDACATERACVFVMLNPSTADASHDDPTVRRCIGFARGWGCTSLTVLNLFALRATDPAALRRHPDPCGPRNDWYICDAISRESTPLIVLAWGAHPMARRRTATVLPLLDGHACFVLGRTRDGWPRHPLYVPRNVQLEAVPTALPAAGWFGREGDGACDENCPMCSGESCRLCGAGSWSNVTDCEHGVLERHERPNGRSGEGGSRL